DLCDSVVNVLQSGFTTESQRLHGDTEIDVPTAPRQIFNDQETVDIDPFLHDHVLWRPFFVAAKSGHTSRDSLHSITHHLNQSRSRRPDEVVARSTVRHVHSLGFVCGSRG